MVLHLGLGVRESTEYWKEVIHDLEDRGLKRPQLIITDGNQGLLRALEDIWPEVPRQRCVIHRSRNVLARVPRKRQDEIKRAVHRISTRPVFMLPGMKQGGFYLGMLRNSQLLPRPWPRISRNA